MDENSYIPLVLAVDDNPANLQVLGNMLKQGGYRVAVATNGRQALDYVARKEPDLILLDVMMPDMDGFEVCSILRIKQKRSDLPILFITALDEAESKLNGFAVGGDDYITKPFSREEVMARVKVFLERQIAMKELENKRRDLEENQKELEKNQRELEKKKMELENSRQALEVSNQSLVEANISLGQANQSLEEINYTLEDRVKERTDTLNKMQSRLMMQEKMAAVGQLAAGISHELNNPVNFVHTNFATLKDNVTDFVSMLGLYRDFVDALADESSSGDFLLKIRQERIVLIKKQEKDLDLDFLLEDIHVLFEESMVGFERITWIVNSMRNFSRKDDSGKKWEFDINQGVMDTLIIAKNEYKYHCKVITELGDVRPILCIPQEINEVLLNLIVNAAQAIKEQKREEPGEILIKTFMEKDKVWCQISDDGAGISEDLKKRIFEPFFTTKEVGKGTGLGLSISYDIIVDKHGGGLSVESRQGHGTTFSIVLPIVLIND